MGDRANVKVDYGQKGPPVYFYTHWNGSNMPEAVREALKRGRNRWDDSQYLPRIIFSTMIADDVSRTTGYGISTYVGDGGDRIIVVDLPNQTVTDYDGNVYSFSEYVGG